MNTNTMLSYECYIPVRSTTQESLLNFMESSTQDRARLFEYSVPKNRLFASVRNPMWELRDYIEDHAWDVIFNLKKE